MDDVLSAELDFHSHPGASLLPSVRFPNREKVGKFLKSCPHRHVRTGSSVKAESSKLLKGQEVAAERKGDTILCMYVLSLAAQLSFQCSDHSNVFTSGNLPMAAALLTPSFCSPSVVKSEVDKAA